MQSAWGVEGGKGEAGWALAEGGGFEMLPKEFGLYHKGNGESLKVFKWDSDLLRTCLGT